MKLLLPLHPCRQAVSLRLHREKLSSRALLQQMIGLGCRTISDEDFHLVTPDTARKTHFVVVDAVGVTDDLPVLAT